MWFFFTYSISKNQTFVWFCLFSLDYVVEVYPKGLVVNVVTSKTQMEVFETNGYNTLKKIMETLTLKGGQKSDQSELYKTIQLGFGHKKLKWFKTEPN